MKKLIIILSFCLFTLTVFSQADIKICTFNIRNSASDDGINNWNTRKTIISAFLKKEENDIICFQEVLTNQLEFLTRDLKNYMYYGVGRNDGKTKGEYAPIFYNKNRFTLLTSKTIWLSPTPSVAGSVGWDASTQRIATFAYLYDRTDNINILVVNTHLDHIGTTARSEGVKLILKTIKQYNISGKTILTGDFNSSPSEEAYQIAAGKWKNIQRLYDARENATKKAMGAKQSFTGYGTQQGEYIIDHIFYDNNFKAVKYTINEVKDGDVYISDHYPVTAILTQVFEPAKNDFGIQELASGLTSPYVKDNSIVFNDKKKITIQCDADDVQLYYTLDNTTPTTKDKLYSKAFFIDKSSVLNIKAFNKAKDTSFTTTYNFYKAIVNSDSKKSILVKLNTLPSHKYEYNPETLCDGKIAEAGSFENWMGFDGTDMDVNLQNYDISIIKAIHLRFLQKANSWIFPPESVTISISNNGKDYTDIKTIKLDNNINKNDPESIVNVDVLIKQKAKYIRIYAKNYGGLPEWHESKGKPAWIFTDEIVLEME